MYANTLVMEKSPLNDNLSIIKRNKENTETNIEEKIKKVAAYCRVSTDLEVQESSLELQMESFKRIIAEHPDWKLAGIFADEGLSGTISDNRLEFQRMMESARCGLIDIILVKSLSRFARNTADSLKYTRELTQMGVSVYFEKEGIDTSSFASEFLLTIFAAFAQEESHSISENIKRGLRNKFKIGEVPWYNVYGYRQGWIIEEKEAEVIRTIFYLYSNGSTLESICKKLNEEKIPTPRNGKRWDKSVVLEIIKNEKYIGDVRLQKTYVSDFMTHKRVNNKNADIEMYYKENNHKPIISKELYIEAQRINRMQGNNGPRLYPYFGFLICPFCHKPMIKVWLDGGIRQSAWTCGGDGKEELLLNRTNCPTYLLQEKLLNKTILKAISSLDKTKYLSFYKQILQAQDEDKITYITLKNLIEYISVDNFEYLTIKWKMSHEEKYKIPYTKANEAMMADIQINKFKVRNKKAYLDGFKQRQKKILRYKVINTDCNVPIILRPDDDYGN